jgi:hypothetical protein
MKWLQTTRPARRRFEDPRGVHTGQQLKALAAELVDIYNTIPDTGWVTSWAVSLTPDGFAIASNSMRGCESTPGGTVDTYYSVQAGGTVHVRMPASRAFDLTPAGGSFVVGQEGSYWFPVSRLELT